jgi:hypothetical protein
LRHDEVSAHEGAHGRPAPEHVFVFASGDEEALRRVGEGEASATARIDDPGIAEIGGRIGMTFGQFEHRGHVIGLQPIIGVEQGHEVRFRAIDAVIPVGYHSEVSLVAVVRDAAVFV